MSLRAARVHAQAARRGRVSSGLLGGLVAAALVGGCQDEGPLVLVGTLERTQIELVAPVSEEIVEIPVARGDEVEAGRLVARLDGTLSEVEVRRAEAALARARTADRVAAHELERARELARKRIASEQALEQAELEREAAAAALLEAQAVVDAARKRARDLSLRAPSRCVVDQLPYEPGERVPAGAVLAVLARLERPWVRVWLPEPWLAGIRPGVEAEVRLDGWPEPLEGRVLDVAREPTFTPHYALTERERAHLAYETRIEVLAADPRLRAGVPASVRFPLREAIPKASTPEPVPSADPRP
ncbi:MAG: HlyD family efflux transporter periplasmic adaptor subunit [Spirochaetaceae bacterium]|nr:HlyD family efflux transporter periplasmic adaptor subunit [Myxococcales bacterium]MCB9724460.1 HlyD family efflux transporter periplasmic adaptor subunit [Spirochaetaceae bacterium]HPG25165.1 HlyD family efflux transporter periplasmic adaptor subunit [Myxococcota bacterium]